MAYPEVDAGTLEGALGFSGVHEHLQHVCSPRNEQALRAHNELALRLLRRGIERLHGHLSTTERLGVDAALLRSLEQDALAFPDEARGAEERYRRQPYRQKLRYVYRKLGATLEASARPWRMDHPAVPGVYRDASELVADLRLLQASLRAHRGERLAAGRLGRLVRQAEIFGFHLASLDLRQTSDRHTSALAEVLGRYAVATGRLGTLVRQAEIFGFHLASLDLRQTSERHASAVAELMGRYGRGRRNLPQPA